MFKRNILFMMMKKRDVSCQLDRVINFALCVRNGIHGILIPPDTENLWIVGYNNKHWGTGWWGDVNGANSIMYSAVVMGFSPANKLIYLPLRKNERPECSKIEDAPPGEPNTMIDDCDLVFTTHQVLFKRSDWTKVKGMFQAAYLSSVWEMKEGYSCVDIYLGEKEFPYRKRLKMWHWPSFDFYEEN